MMVLALPGEWLIARTKHLSYIKKETFTKNVQNTFCKGISDGN